MSSLTKAEKNQIIINEAKGIQHPLYYVCETKSGGVQVRKRKVPLITEVASIEKEPPKEPVKEEDVYDQVTNKQLLEKMLQILENNIVSKNENLNSVENERETEENRKFVENIETEKIKEQQELVKHEQQQIPKPNGPNPYLVRRRGRVL